MRLLNICLKGTLMVFFFFFSAVSHLLQMTAAQQKALNQAAIESRWGRETPKTGRALCVVEQG